MNDRIHLLSCDGCSRQLDVTALEVGDEVMCVCERVLVVGPPRIVQVRGLECRRCGGAIGEGDTTCSYCSAKLSEADRVETTLCPSCATRIPNDSQHCKGCGVEIRAAAVPPLPVGRGCPRCDQKLRVHLFEDAELIECASEAGCGGIWCPKDAFERLRHNALHQRGPATAPPELGGRGEAPAAQGRAYLACLTCSQLMQRRQFRHQDRPSGIVLDVCKDHGLWFDRDELQAVLDFVRRQKDLGVGATVARLPSAPQQAGPMKFEPARRPKKGARDYVDDVFDAIAEVFTFSLFD